MQMNVNLSIDAPPNIASTGDAMREVRRIHNEAFSAKKHSTTQ